MPRKRGQDEEIIMFAMKVVGPVAVFFIIAAATDVSHFVRWANAGPIDAAAYGISDMLGSIFSPHL